MARVLIIDDNDDMLTMLQLLLQRRGNHTVTTSNNGIDGLDKAFNDVPDIMIVDVMMPGLNGYDVVNRIRADARTRAIPVIILTARGQPVDRNAALEVGANSYLSKPVDIEKLLTTITNLLEMGSYANLPERLVVPVISLKGGVGVTSIAVNLALLFQQIAPTILWDLSPSSGHGALTLGMQPTSHWGNVIQTQENTVSTALLRHSSGLRLLAAPPIPNPTTWFDDRSIQVLYAELLKLSSIVVIDMPSFLDKATAAILQEAHQIILVSSDDNPGIQTTLATMQGIKSIMANKVAANRLMVVRNSTRSEATDNIELLQRALGQPVNEDIPFDKAQSNATQRGTPLAVSQPTSPMMKTLKHLAHSILTSRW